MVILACRLVTFLSLSVLQGHPWQAEDINEKVLVTKSYDHVTYSLCIYQPKHEEDSLYSQDQRLKNIWRCDLQKQCDLCINTISVMEEFLPV